MLVCLSKGSYGTRGARAPAPGPGPEPRALGPAQVLREFLPWAPGPGLGPPEEALMGSGALTGPRGAPAYETTGRSHMMGLPCSALFVFGSGLCLPGASLLLVIAPMNSSSRKPPRDSTGPRGPLAPLGNPGGG